MNQVIKRPPPGAMQQSALLDNSPEEWDDLSAGVAASFPIIGIKAGKWHFRWKGEDTIVSDERGFAVPAINVVILKGQKELSRTYYPPGSYTEGANNPPSCWSSDGVRPDDTVEEPVNPVCATCPNAAWGSGATAASPKAQACSQRRRLVVIPYNPDDLTNADQGGPCLLSVPPSALRNLDEFSTLLKQNRLRYHGCITQLSFDQSPNIAFPKIEFQWAAALTDNEVQEVNTLRASDAVSRILTSKINPDVEADAPVPQAAAPQATPKAPPQAAAPVNTGVKAAPQPAINRATPAMARPMAQAAPVATKVAAPAATGQAAPPPKPTRVGGFAVGNPATPINNAVAKPAAPPASARVVKAAPQPEVQEPDPEMTEAQAVAEDNEGGSVPDALNSAFGNLMGNP